MRGYAVIDIETTGFSFRRGHRIVEIGVVELSPDGELEGSWGTLINPQRHIEATEIHGISASDVLGAPTFDQVADKLASSLEDRIFVAHNAGFDRAFIQAELTDCGAYSGDDLLTVDTLVLAREFLGRLNRGSRIAAATWESTTNWRTRRLRMQWLQRSFSSISCIILLRCVSDTCKSGWPINRSLLG